MYMISFMNHRRNVDQIKKEEAQSHCDIFRQGGVGMIDDSTYNKWFSQKLN